MKPISCIRIKVIITIIIIKILKKRQVLSPYWFAAQQQISIFRRQKIDPFYLKFKAELNEFVPKLKMQQEEAQKLLKPRCG